MFLKLLKVYAVVYEEEKRMTDVPKQVWEIAEKLNLDIFPKGWSVWGIGHRL